MILVDLQKAFDTLDHIVLLRIWNVLVLDSQSLNGFNHISQTEIFSGIKLCWSTRIYLGAAPLPKGSPKLSI